MSEPAINGPYSIGQNHWPGLARLMEEMGELQQVLGKVMASGGNVQEVVIARWRGVKLVYLPGDEPAGYDPKQEPKPLEIKVPEILYYDKTLLLTRLREEIADVLAAIEFFVVQNAESLHANSLDEDGSLVSGEWYMEEQKRHKLANFYRYHDKSFRNCRWVPDGLADRREHFIDSVVEEHGPAGCIVATGQPGILQEGPPTQAKSIEAELIVHKDLTRPDQPYIVCDESDRSIAEGYAADIEGWSC
jgi:NTP pyrophosphatase (non-canonical NTP hydrolase)